MRVPDSINSPVGIQAKLEIGKPGDKYEREADSVADRVMSMPSNGNGMQVAHQMNTPSINMKCEECEKENLQMKSLDEEDKLQMKSMEDEEKIQMKPSRGNRSGDRISTSPETSLGINSTKGNGKALPQKVALEMAGKMGFDFNPVNIHTGSKAIQMNRDLGSQAFTHGSDIYFNRGKYDPGSNKGKHLIAHELTHVVQQGKTNALDNSTVNGSRPPPVQRKLVVDDTVPSDPNEPASGLSQPAFRSRVFPQANTLIQSLCNQFQVDNNGEIKPITKDVCKDKDKVSTSSNNPLGCCCLCIITDPTANTWKLTISEFQGPHTDPAGRNVVVHPFGSLFGFGNWAVPDPATGNENLVDIDPVTVLGHELCGHAALLELDAHAPIIDRVRNNEHDSTVRVQNIIGHEQGVSVNDDRAEAAQGTHRGESTANVTLTNFPFNATSISQLPPGQQNALQTVANFARANNLWIDILGHSDTIGSAAAKLAVSQNRANSVQNFLLGQGLTLTFSRRGLTNVDRYTRVEGRSDFDLLPGSVPGVPDPNLRRVDIIMTSRPAGAQNPDPATPTTITNVGPTNPANVATLKASGNACEQLLVGIAWP